MKKIILTSAVALLSTAAAFAQHAGQAGIGANIGVAPVIEGSGSPTNFLLGGRLQYSFTDMVRGTLDLNGGFEDRNISTFDATANINIMIPLSDGFYLYPLAGLGYGNVHSAGGDYWIGNREVAHIDGQNFSKFVFNIGLGAEYEFSRNFAAGLEFKYRYMKDYEALPVHLNLSYKF